MQQIFRALVFVVIVSSSVGVASRDRGSSMHRESPRAQPVGHSPASVARPGDESLSCEAIRAEGDRELAAATQASTDMGQIEVSDAPARAAASAAVAIGVLRTIAGAAGGGGLAGAVAGTAGDLAVIGSSKAAQVAMNREFDNKANDVERQFSAAQDRWSYLVDLYHKKCI